MQLITIAAAAALSATAAATGSKQFNFNSTSSGAPSARIFNRCPYTVYAWSVVSDEQFDCDDGEPAVIAPGGFYEEEYRKPSFGGISIKLSKEKKGKKGSLTQLEYHLELANPEFAFNSLDVSYVDCGNNDCPTRQEGYYLQSGNVEKDGVKAYATKGDGSICPVLSCHDQISCNKCSYVLPDDVQTKTCENDAPLDFYMCGGEAPGESNPQPVQPSSSYDAPAAPSSTVETPAPSEAAPSEAAPSSKKQEGHHEEKPTSAAYAEVQAAAVTPAPEAAAPPNVKTAVVYETVYVDAKKRHAHGRRHQHYHA